MTSKSMRSFAAGLIVAAGVCGAAYFSGPSKATSKQTAEKPSEGEMKSLLTAEGYVVHTEKEWEEQLSAVKGNSKEATKEKIIYRTMLSVSSGMTSIDVEKALKRAKIIDNRMDFFNAVEKRGLSNDLRPGIYEVESGMTIDEIIATIFK
jgi:cell division protein YceG involved in septum cleavage